MKTLHLIRCLTAKERKTFGKAVNKHKRGSLGKLYKALVKHNSGDTPDKSQLFRSTFGEEYTPAKDYLLRNELRLLNNELSDFLVNSELQTTCRNDPYFKAYWLQQAFTTRGQLDLFNSQFNRLAGEAQDRSQWEYLAASEDQNRLLTFRSQGFNSEDKNLVLADINRRRIAMLTRRYVQELRETEMQLMFAVTQLRRTQPDAELPQVSKTVDLHAAEFNDDYSRATYYLAQTYHLEGEEHLAALQRAYDHVSQANVFGKNHDRHRMVLLARMAIHCSKIPDIERLGTYVEHLNDLSRESGIALTPEVSVLMADYHYMCKNYQGAIDYIAAMPEQTRNSPRVKADLLLSSNMARLMIGEYRDVREATAALQHSDNLRDRVQQRFIEAAVYFLEGNTEEAERLFHNLQHVMRYNENNGSIAPWLQACVKLIVKIIRTAQYPPAETVNRWPELLEEAAALESGHSAARAAAQLPIHWTFQQLERLSGLRIPNWKWDGA